MRDSYDFSKGVRGKYAGRIKKGIVVTMEIELTVNEEHALNDLARSCELSPNQVIRQALRLFQLRHHMQGAGVDAVWRNRETGMIVESPLDEGGGCMGDDDEFDPQAGAGDQRDV